MPIVSQPGAGAIHIDQSLTNFALKWRQDEDKFVADMAFPMIPVMHQSDKYHEFDLDSWLANTAKRRADGDEAPQGGWKMSQDTYFADVWSFAKPITDRQRANQDNAISLERAAVQFVMQKMTMAKEVVMQQQLFRTNRWYNGTSAAHAGQTPSVKWDVSSADPIKEIRAACRAVESRTGIMPNKMLMGRRAWHTLFDSDAIREYIVGGATTGQPAIVTRQLVAQALELEMVHVAGAVTKQASADANYIFGDNALVYYAPNVSEGIDGVTGGTQFTWGAPFNGGQGLAIKVYRDEKTMSDIVEGNEAFDFKLTAPELGYLFTDVST